MLAGAHSLMATGAQRGARIERHPIHGAGEPAREHMAALALPFVSLEHEGGMAQLDVGRGPLRVDAGDGELPQPRCEIRVR